MHQKRYNLCAIMQEKEIDTARQSLSTATQKRILHIRFNVYASPRAMRFWNLQFGRYVKVLQPQSLCDIIKEDIAEMQKLYEE